MKKTIVSVVVLIALGYIALGPFFALLNIREALETDDAEMLSDNIDFPSVRQSLKEQLTAQLASKAANELSDNPLGAIGAAFADKLVEGLLEAFVTPSGLTSLASGENPLRGKSTDTASESVEHQAPRLDDLWENSRFSYDSLDRFSVWILGDDGSEVRIVLRRNGLDWDVTTLSLPAGLFD
jgi:hypothetical protein|tara:strand:+ start:164 stop:709 length:546 start_codon:yes stop_codon:yes gene_type:complete